MAVSVIVIGTNGGRYECVGTIGGESVDGRH